MMGQCRWQSLPWGEVHGVLQIKIYAGLSVDIGSCGPLRFVLTSVLDQYATYPCTELSTSSGKDIVEVVNI